MVGANYEGDTRILGASSSYGCIVNYRVSSL